MPGISENFPQFGKGHYNLDTLYTENAEPRLRGTLTEEEQLPLLKTPNGDINYVAQAVLLRTSFEIKEQWLKFLSLQQNIPRSEPHQENVQEVLFEIRQDIQYIVIDLDEDELSVLFAASGKSPQEIFWVKLIDDLGQTAGHVRFHAREVTILSSHSLIIKGDKSGLQRLSINTDSDVLIQHPLRAENNIHISCHSLKLDSPQQDPALLKADCVDLTCLEQCIITTNTDIVTKYCRIQAAHLLHQGYLESTESAHIVSELAEIQGTIAARGKNGIAVISLGMQASASSHLHGSSLNLLVGAPVHNSNSKHPLLGKLLLEGQISCINYSFYSYDTTFNLGTTYVQGKNALAALHKTKANPSATLVFKRESHKLHTDFAAFIDWTVKQDDDLEIFWKKVIYQVSALPDTERLRMQLPRPLVSTQAKATPSRRTIEFFPVLPNQANYSYKGFDQAQFIPLESEPQSPPEDKQPQITYSAGECLSVASDMSLSNAQISMHAKHLSLFNHITRTSSFGSVDVFTKSDDLTARDVSLHTGEAGRTRFEAKNMQVADCAFTAGEISLHAESLSFSNKNTTKETTVTAARKIHIQSSKNSEVQNGTTLILKSPLPVTWECDNFYLRGGRIEFEQLSIHAKHLVSMLKAELKGKRLQVDAEKYLAFLAHINIDELSIQSVLSVTWFCILLNRLYANTAIVGVSSSLHLPSSFHLTGKSVLSCSLAAVNSLISILQMVLYEPSSQVALAALRLGVNAAPALMQLHQLSRNIAEASKAPALSRAQSIQIANQTKTIILSLGSLAYSVPGILDLLSQPSSSALPSFPSWDAVFTELNSVATPLMTLALPGGLQTSNFVNVAVNADFCLSDTTSSGLNAHGGFKSSLVTADSTVVDGVLPVALDVSPVMSTKSSFYSISTSPESIVPLGSHSERTVYKTCVSAGPFPLPQYLSLSAKQLTAMHGTQVFNNSSLQIKRIDVSNGGGAVLNNSSLSVTDTENDGPVEFNHSQLTSSGTWHNGAAGKTLSVNSNLNFKQIKNELGSATQYIATKFNAGHWEEGGVFAADAFSEVNADEAVFDKPSRLGGRTSKWALKHVKNNSDAPIFVDFQGTQLGQADSFNFEDKSPLTAALTDTGRIKYHSDKPMGIKDTGLVGVCPLGLEAPDLPVDGNVSSNVPLLLKGTNTLSTNQAQLKVKGQLDMQGGKVNFNGGHVEAEKTMVSGKKVSAQNGAEVIGQKGLRVESDEPLDSVGKVTVEVKDDTHHHRRFLFFTEKEKTKKTETSYQNNVFASTEGNVELISNGDNVNLQGTDMLAPNGSVLFGSHHNINFRPSIGPNSIAKQYSNLFQHENTFDMQDSASVCHIFSGVDILFQLKGDLYNLGTVMNSKGRVIYDFQPGHRAINERLLLNVSHSDSRWGLYLNTVAGINVGPNHDSRWDHLPLVNSLSELNESRGLMDTVAAATGVGVESANLADRLLKAAKKGQLSTEALKTLGLGDEHGFNPVLGWQFGLSQRNAHYQILGPGSITTPLIIARGGEIDFEQGYSVYAKHGIFDVDVLKSNGATLKASSRSSDTQLEFSTSLTDVVGGGVSLKQNNASLEQHAASNNLNFKRLDLHARQVILNDSVITADKLAGHADSISSRSSFNKINQSGFALHASSDGSFSVGAQNEHTKKVAVPVAFSVKDASEFTCGDAEFIGQTAPGIHPDHGRTVPLYDVSHKNQLSVGVPASIFSQGDRASGNLFTSIKFNFTSHNYLARHDDAGTTMLHDSNNHFRVNLPVYHPEAGRQFLNNINWLFSSLWPFEQDTEPTPPVLPISHSQASMKPRSFVTKSSHTSINIAGCYTAKSLNPGLVFSPDSTEQHRYHHSKAVAYPELVLINSPSITLKSEEMLYKDVESYGRDAGARASYRSGTALYKGTAAHPDQVHHHGMSAPGTNDNLLQYALTDLDEGNLEDSHFIGATPSRKMASTFPRTDLDINHSYVYRIESARPVIHVAAALRHYVHLGLIDPDDFNTLLREQGRVFVSGIFPHEIKGAWKVSTIKIKTADITDFDLSDFFSDAEKPPQSLIDAFCYEYQRTIGTEFIPNPKFISPDTHRLLWKSVGILGKSLTSLGVGLDTISLLTQFKDSLESNHYDNTYHEAARIAGGWTGAWKVGSAFAKEGAIRCAPFTPYVEAACVVGFGAVGSAVGYFTLGATASKIYDVAASERHQPAHEQLPSLRNAAAFFNSSQQAQNRPAMLVSPVDLTRSAKWPG